MVFAVERNWHGDGHEHGIGQKEPIRFAGEASGDRRIVERHRCTVDLNRHGRYPGEAQPGRDLSRGKGRITTLVNLGLQGAIGLDPAEEADPDRDRRGLHFDAGVLQHAVCLMRRRRS